MDTLSIVLISVLGVLLLVVIIVLIIFLFRGRRTSGDSEVNNLSLKHDIEKNTSEQINQLSEKISGQLDKIKEDIKDQNTEFKDKVNESINTKFDQMNEKVDTKLGDNFKTTNDTILKVNESLENIKATQKNLDDMSKDVVSLKTVLEGNQTRGAYGEIQLSNILRQYFHEPSNGTYLEQYSFDNGDSSVRADAVVFLPNDLFVCVDSKFPFTDYERLFDKEITDEEKNELNKVLTREIKKHIDDISKKYVVDGLTFNQAIMFIPSDGIDAYIHYELRDVVDYAYTKNVMIASPRTLGPLLTEIIMLKQEAKRNEYAKELQSELQDLGVQFRNFDSEWKTFSNRIDGLNTDFGKINKRANRIVRKFNNINTSELEFDKKEAIENEESGFQQVEDIDLDIDE